MELSELHAKAARLFPLSVRFAIARPADDNIHFEHLQQMVKENYARLGFRCHADCFAEIVPQKEGILSLDSWCKAELVVSGWLVKVTMRPFYFGAGYVHFEIRHKGEIPGLTATGYRSAFTPLRTFSEVSPEEYLSVLIPPAPLQQQLMLL